MASMSDAHVQQVLLQDPFVQDAMKRAGESALADPEVQRRMVEACKEKFPELAGKARDQVLQWAKDPELQRQAQQYAGVALDYAKQSAARAGEDIFQLIEQGPAGIRILAFGGGCASCANASSILLGALNPLTWLTNSAKYVIAAYQILFAVTTMLFEAPPEWIAMVPGVTDYQDLLIRKARFLSETAGRGAFYLFQGSLWLTFASLLDIVSLVVGLVFLALAGIHVSMHFGVVPQELAQKMRAGAVAGYLPLPVSADADDFAPAREAAREASLQETAAVLEPAASPEAECPASARQQLIAPASPGDDEAPVTVKAPVPAAEESTAVAERPPPLWSRTPTPEGEQTLAAEGVVTSAPAAGGSDAFSPSPRPDAVAKPKCCVVS